MAVLHPVTQHRATERSTTSPTLGAMVLEAARRHPGVAIRHRTERGWNDITYAEFGTTAREIARGLMALGVHKGDHVAILASTRAEWTLVDCGAQCAGAVVVPVYHTNSPTECHYVLEHSDAKVVFCEDAAQVAKIQQVRDRLPALEHVISFDDSGDVSLAGLRARATEIDADAVDRVVAQVHPHDVATIVYTSGTTGPPKGCLTTHANCMSTIAMYEAVLDFEPGAPVVIFMFLPLAHSLARMVELLTLDIGGTLGFWRGDAKVVLEDILEIRPTHLPSVPRVFEKIHTRALAGVQDGGRAKEVLLRRAVTVGRRVRELERRGGHLGPVLRAEHRLLDKLVLHRIRDLFGSRLELALTGAAPVAPEILEFFDAAGVLVLEGYGLTETTAAGTLNTVGAFRFGTVGRPLPGSEVAIADDGEVLLRGPNIFPGYHKNPEATEKTFAEDGWMRTGDLGAVDADGYLKITGRKKDLIITSSGKNISPANLESSLREHRWVSQAVVFGDNRPYLVALLTLDPDELDALAAHCGVPRSDIATMATRPEVRAELQAAVDATNAHVARIEQVKRFAILDHDLTQETGELTPTAKLKRNVVYERYAEAFARLYDEAEG